MNHRLRAVLLSLAALLAVGSVQAIAATAASARPHFEERPGSRLSLTGKETTIETTSGSSGMVVKCQTVSGTPEWQGLNGITATISLKGCSAKFSMIPIAHCTSAGAALGEIKTNLLGGMLVYLSQAKHEVGMLFSDGSSPLASFECGANAEILSGSVIAKVTPINTDSLSFALSAKGAAGVQELTQYEGESGERLSSKLELSSNKQLLKADLSSTGFEMLTTTLNRIVA